MFTVVSILIIAISAPIAWMALEVAVRGSGLTMAEFEQGMWETVVQPTLSSKQLTPDQLTKLRQHTHEDARIMYSYFEEPFGRTNMGLLGIVSLMGGVAALGLFMNRPWGRTLLMWQTMTSWFTVSVVAIVIAVYFYRMLNGWMVILTVQDYHAIQKQLGLYLSSVLVVIGLWHAFLIRLLRMASRNVATHTDV